jgi:hypothetical protein
MQESQVRILRDLVRRNMFLDIPVLKYAKKEKYKEIKKEKK